MTLSFTKYQGAGNDFVICDDRSGRLVSVLDTQTIAHICDRRFGVGADGLMLLAAAADGYDFTMDYYNSDGRRSTMCGNGGRCLVQYAADLGIVRSVYRFLAIDGPHEAEILNPGTVSLGMSDVAQIQVGDGDYVLDTGSPHFVRFVPRLNEVDVVTDARKVRYAEPYRGPGINVNFVEVDGDHLHIATYERGVEDETLACGTGVTAAAVAHLYRLPATQRDGAFRIPVRARGGDLEVTGTRIGDRFTDLRLVGPATYVFRGEIVLPNA